VKKILIITALLAALTSCNMSNPLLRTSKLKYGAPEFDKIKTENYVPAFKKSISDAKKDIQVIIDNKEKPSFENTIVAMEYAGMNLTRVSGIFFNLLECDGTPELQAVAKEVSPMVTEYSMFVSLNKDLFQRVKTLYNQKESLNLEAEQMKLLIDTYKSFSRNGAALSSDKKAEFSKIAQESSKIGLAYNENMLKAQAAYTLHITDRAKLAGLPHFAIGMAAHEAKTRKLEGWVFTLDYPSFGPFIKYSAVRELREEIYKAFAEKCVGGEFDNTENIKKLIDCRIKEANLLNYKTYADYALENRMAENTQTVEDFLEDLRIKSLPFAKKEVKELSAYAHKLGLKGELMPWDWSYYSAKLKNEKYSINDELLKPYFKLENVRQAIFNLAHKLYGLNYTETNEFPVYNKDVKVYDITDANGKHMALLYMDNFPRATKSSGAWMTEFIGEYQYKGKENRPIIQIVTNFTKPTDDEPSLLSHSEVTTLLHEFGHSLHGTLAEGTYPSQTGTSVARDFVELPSQIMENFAFEKEFLESFAKNYKTGEAIPIELINKIKEAKNFQAGYASLRQVSLSILDMDWHTQTTVPKDVIKFEKNAMKDCRVLPTIDDTAISPSFGHIFAGGYSAGYYSYKWAEVLEADAFSLFKEKGIFNKEVAKSFRDNILSQGSRREESVSFRMFRGRDPKANALMEKLGLTKDKL